MDYAPPPVACLHSSRICDGCIREVIKSKDRAVRALEDMKARALRAENRLAEVRRVLSRALGEV